MSHHFYIRGHCKGILKYRTYFTLVAGSSYLLFLWYKGVSFISHVVFGINANINAHWSANS